MMVKKDIRGGISQWIKRYMQANNKHTEGYHPTNKDSYFWYVDANNLYVHLLSQYLPYKGFKRIVLLEK